MPLFDVYPVHPITITRGQGSWVWDDMGNRYLDMYGGHAVISVGHTHPTYVDRLTKQVQQIGFYSNSIRIPQQQDLANKLAAITGMSDYALFLCNSGAEANENAMKLASFHTGRKKLVCFTGAFHGRTSLAVEATDNPSIAAPINATGNMIRLPFNDIRALEECFHADGEAIAGVIVEGILGVGGIRVASDLFLHAIRRLCDQYGSVYIADSVQCGYARTGSFFAHDHSGVRADIYSMAKGMGNGFPVAGIWIAPHIQAKHYLLGTTFGGNHLACAAALAVLDIIESEGLLANAQRMGAYLQAQLKDIPGVQDVRGRGLMIGFDIPERIADVKKSLLYTQRVFTGEAKPNTIRLLPALNLQQEEADHFLHALKSSLNA
jgi:acetylornithine aminotransferase